MGDYHKQACGLMGAGVSDSSAQFQRQVDAFIRQESLRKKRSGQVIQGAAPVEKRGDCDKTERTGRVVQDAPEKRWRRLGAPFDFLVLQRQGGKS